MVAANSLISTKCMNDGKITFFTNFYFFCYYFQNKFSSFQKSQHQKAFAGGLHKPNYTLDVPEMGDISVAVGEMLDEPRE